MYASGTEVKALFSLVPSDPSNHPASISLQIERSQSYANALKYVLTSSLILKPHSTAESKELWAAMYTNCGGAHEVLLSAGPPYIF